MLYKYKWPYVRWLCPCWPKWRKTWPNGTKIFNLRNLGMRHINRSALQCFTTINYVRLSEVVHVDQSDEKRCQPRGHRVGQQLSVLMGQKAFSLRNLSMWNISGSVIQYNALQVSITKLDWNWKCSPKLPKTWPNGAKIFRFEKPGHAKYQ